WSRTDGPFTGVDNTDRLVNIPAGNYKVVITDTLGCSGTFTVPITEPAGLSLDVLKVSHAADTSYNISCNGGSDGYLKMAISGGSGINTYRWTGPNGFTANTEDITGLKAGTYTCRVSAGIDTSSCKLTPSPTYTLKEPAALDISYVTSHSVNGNYEINCNGGTGYVDITVTGGSIGNYTYVWSTADGSGIVAGQPDQPSLKAGTYHLAVQDLNGCMKATDIVMKEPPAFALQLTPQHITCITPGFNNGSVNLEVSGGVAPYAYSWSNGAITQDISGLTAGYYKVTASYNNTCQKIDSIKINLPPQLTFDKQIKSLNSYEISCFGRSDGQISVNPTSGNAPFAYSWAGPGGFISTDKDLQNLKAGEYHLKITDSNMCNATDTITMREPGPLGMTFALSSSNAGGFNINCAGDSTGLIIVQPINSVNNVTFLWADGFTGRTRTDLGAGIYNVIITDANNCQASGNATLTQPDSIKVSFSVKNPFCPDMPDGSISISVKGGVPGAEYMYKWSDKSSGNSIANIPEGLFKLRVEDLNGCVLRDSVLVEPENPTCLGVPNIISPNGDLVNDTWIIDRKELYPAMEVKIFNRRGKLVWKSDRGYGKPWDGKGNGVELPIDSYHYIIDLHDGSKPVLGTITIVK
ncbi:MAG: gliding motility-associated C-terminal domain-containing protein, partial [Methanosarcina sp.]